MKKVLMFLLAVVLLSSCNSTSPDQDIAFLQKIYPTVYKINAWEHVVVDSTGVVYHVRMTTDGGVRYKIRIK